MDNREARAAADALDWQLVWATIAGYALVGWRVLSVIIVLSADDGTWPLALATLGEAAVCAVLVMLMRQQRLTAAIALVAIWATGFLYSWYASGRIVPPFALVSLLIGAGLAQGIRAILGRRAFEQLRASEPAV